MSHAASGALPIGVTEFALARRRAILSCAIGNFFELFDFTIYGFFAVAISRAFFPAGDPVLAMASTFATFGVAFVLRPVGAIVLGAYGDRAGRRAALVVTIGSMATATGMTGLIPTYASIGILGAHIVADLPHDAGVFHRWRMGRRGDISRGICADRQAGYHGELAAVQHPDRLARRFHRGDRSGDRPLRDGVL